MAQTRSPAHNTPFGLSEGTWVWIILAGGFALFFPLLSFDSDWYVGAGALAIMVAGGFLLHIIPGVTLIAYLRSRWLRALVLVAIYVSVGLLYALLRWELYVPEWRRKHDALQVIYLKERTLTVLPEDKVKEWKSVYTVRIGPRPSAAYNEKQFKRWWFLWPWDGMVFVFSDMVRELINYTYHLVGNIMDWQAERHLRGVK
ncbi:MAG: hypothetical protein AAB421_03125 [Patescibacteria group bacterium]